LKRCDTIIRFLSPQIYKPVSISLVWFVNSCGWLFHFYFSNKFFFSFKNVAVFPFIKMFYLIYWRVCRLYLWYGNINRHHTGGINLPLKTWIFPRLLEVFCNCFYTGLNFVPRTTCWKTLVSYLMNGNACGPVSTCHFGDIFFSQLIGVP